MRTATHPPGALVSLTVALTRSVALLAVLAALSGAYLLALDAHGTRPHVPATDTPAGHDIWRESYSRRFPGCVAVVLWTPGAVPRALLVRDRRGTLSKVSPQEAAVRFRDGEARAVGMCR